MLLQVFALVALLTAPSTTADAFAPSSTGAARRSTKPRRPFGLSRRQATSSTAVVNVPTEPIAGMKPGTSGLRKKVEVWQNTAHYVENFIQALLDTATAKNGGKTPETYVCRERLLVLVAPIVLFFAYILTDGSYFSSSLTHSVSLSPEMADTLTTRPCKSFVVCWLPMASPTFGFPVKVAL